MLIAWLVFILLYIHLNTTKALFERIYREEQDVKAKERMLLVLNAVYHGMVTAHVICDNTFIEIDPGPAYG